VAKERACTNVICVVSGAINPKQIELEVMNLIGADVWRWNARPVIEGKFQLRFPTAQMANQWSFVKNLTMRSGAQIQIDSWSPAMDAKGFFKQVGLGLLKSQLIRDHIGL
jgi:hypothetical protein